MDKVVEEGHVVEKNDGHHIRDWRRSMSDNVALALLVAGIIPFCRKYEHRWTALTDEQAVDPALAGAFRRDQIALWLLAISTPLILTGFFMLIFS